MRILILTPKICENLNEKYGFNKNETLFNKFKKNNFTIIKDGLNIKQYPKKFIK